MKNILSESLQITLSTKSLNAISAEYLELGIDTLIDNELIKSIPIIKTISGLYKFSKSAQEYFLTKKIVRFLFKIKDVSQDEIQKTLLRIDSKKSHRIELGEHIVLLLDKFENIYKSDLLGNAFKMYLKQQLTIDEFLRASHIIEKSYYDDLLKLEVIDKKSKVNKITLENLISLGLLSLKPFKIDTGIIGKDLRSELNKFDYSINDSGKLILRILEMK
jgi:hypothetical protein